MAAVTCVKNFDKQMEYGAFGATVITGFFPTSEKTTSSKYSAEMTLNRSMLTTMPCYCQFDCESKHLGNIDGYCKNAR